MLFSWARPLRVLPAPGSGAPWLPDLGPGRWRLKDLGQSVPSGQQRPADAGSLHREPGGARVLRSPPGKAVPGHGWRWPGVLAWERMHGFVFVFPTAGEGVREERAHEARNRRVAGPRRLWP